MADEVQKLAQHIFLSFIIKNTHTHIVKYNTHQNINHFLLHNKNKKRQPRGMGERAFIVSTDGRGVFILM